MLFSVVSHIVVLPLQYLNSTVVLTTEMFRNMTFKALYHYYVIITPDVSCISNILT